MKKLYTVVVETEIVVVAEDEEDAIDAAEKAVRDMTASDYAYEANEMQGLPNEWETETLPYGSHEDKTIAEWITAGAAEVYKAATTKRQIDAETYLARHQKWIKDQEAKRLAGDKP